MAEVADLFARVKNYQQQAQGGQAPGMDQYAGRLGAVRDAYYQRLEAERQQNAAKFFGTLAQQQQGGGGYGSFGGGSAIDRFMAAISGQESGGDYNIVNEDSGAHGRFQIMPDNWPSWSREAGLGPNAPRTAQNQDRVARYKMEQYYKQTGSWDLVARMWYAGPGSLDYSAGALSRRQGGGKYPSINDYVRSVMRRMG